MAYKDRDSWMVKWDEWEDWTYGDLQHERGNIVDDDVHMHTSQPWHRVMELDPLGELFSSRPLSR